MRPTQREIDFEEGKQLGYDNGFKYGLAVGTIMSGPMFAAFILLFF